MTNHTEGGWEEKIDLSTFGKQDFDETLRTKDKITGCQHYAQVSVFLTGVWANNPEATLCDTRIE